MITAKKIFLLVLILLISCSSSDVGVEPGENEKTIVELYGLIQAKGNLLVDKNNEPVQLHGMSLFWSQWGGHYYNEKVVQWLKDDWKCTVVRAAIGVESGGYLANSQAELTKATIVIEAAIKNGIYVVVDWHDHNAEKHIAQAKEFFDAISKKYGAYNNIIYEIYNEPLNVSWSSVLKPYSEEIIKVIRQNDPDNLILVGTPNWSQDVDAAAKDPIVDKNVAYAFHYYTSTHKQSLRSKAITAMNLNIPIFVSEYGISEASGNGNIDFAETEKWNSFVNDYKLSTCNWSIMDKNETSAALKPGASADGNWIEADLTISGNYIRNLIRTANKEIFEKFK